MTSLVETRGDYLEQKNCFYNKSCYLTGLFVEYLSCGKTRECRLNKKRYSGIHLERPMKNKEYPVVRRLNTSRLLNLSGFHYSGIRQFAAGYSKPDVSRHN